MKDRGWFLNLKENKKKHSDNCKELELTNEQTDMLKEFGNIGSGNAATALSNLLNKFVEMSLTSINIVPFWKIPYFFKNEKIKVFGISSKIEGEYEFNLLQIYPKDAIIKIINNLTDFEKVDSKKINIIENLDDFSLSIIVEMGNILTGHYSSALANLLSTKLIPDVPKIALDYISALTNCIIAKYSELLDFTILIGTSLSIEDIELTAALCFIPSVETIYRFSEYISTKYNF